MKSRNVILLTLVLGLLFTIAWTVAAQEESAGTSAATSKFAPPETPGTITLDQIPPDPEFGNFYGPVEFNHKLHEGFGCSICHHHFEQHKLAGIVPDSLKTTETCGGCHHMDQAPYTQPMSCSNCHQPGQVDGFLAVKSNFACTVCHDIEMSMEPRIVKISDSEIYQLPTLKGIYHQKCLECHKTMGANAACDYCHKPNESAK